MTAVGVRRRDAAHWDRAFKHGAEYVPVDEDELELFRIHVKAEPGMRAVDLGCGTGSWTRELAKLGLDVMGFDFSHVAIKKATALTQGHEWAGPRRKGDAEITAPRFGVWDVTGDAIPLHLAPRCFDIVTMRHSAAYFGDLQRLLGDARRWLTPDGVVYIVTPVIEQLPSRLTHRGLTEHEVQTLRTGWRSTEYNVSLDGSVIAVILQYPR
ncbi:class I SAM-dependent methyltransferase [Streptomyces sp. NBC_01431]|uniref:class I SAM-dependent methyltransferase n=1 Tax=Streptomyces sp. NBC_01431 TaxID=2903863 RepID=UPI002E34AAFD|nr:class I SAM-dependent methyltransferase [Streptomyces sp. NBC_01431]